MKINCSQKNRNKTKAKNMKCKYSTIVETNTKSIVQAMSQLSMRDLEIVGLKSQNKNLVDVVLKKEERKALENKGIELLDINEKLVKKLSRQFPCREINISSGT